jgi:hypothetical protein
LAALDWRLLQSGNPSPVNVAHTDEKEQAAERSSSIATAATANQTSGKRAFSLSFSVLTQRTFAYGMCFFFT